VISIVAAVIMAGLALFGFIQANNATDQRNVAQTAQVNSDHNASVAQTVQADAEQQAFNARIGELAAVTVNLREKQPVLSLLLGIETFRLQDNLRTRLVLMDNLNLNPQVLQYFSGHSGGLESVAFSPDGKLLVSGGTDKSITIWDLQTHRLLGSLQSEQPSVVRSLAFSPDSKILAAGYDDHTIILWDVKALQPFGMPLSGHSDIVRSIAFNPDGKMLASGSEDSTIIEIKEIASRHRITPWI